MYMTSETIWVAKVQVIAMDKNYRSTDSYKSPAIKYDLQLCNEFLQHTSGQAKEDSNGAVLFFLTACIV